MVMINMNIYIHTYILVFSKMHEYISMSCAVFWHKLFLIE